MMKCIIKYPGNLRSKIDGFLENMVILFTDKNNDNNNNKNNNTNIPETRKYWVDVQQEIALCHVEKDLL